VLTTAWRSRLHLPNCPPRRAAEAYRHCVADLEMDLMTRRVKQAGRNVELTVREFELLEYLLRYERQVVSREALGRSVWKEQSASTTLSVERVMSERHLAYAFGSCVQYGY